MSLALSLYGAATGLAEPFAPLLLRSRARRGKEDAGRLAERLGRPGAARPDGPLVWLHGVSVGEVTSLLPLAEALKDSRPGLNLLITSGTVTSAKALEGRLPAGAIHQFLPIDAPAAARRFLAHWRPDLGVLAESELWPNLIRAAHRRGTPLVLASARMTEKSAAGWAKWPGAARALLGGFKAVLPQDAASAARLEGLGARVGPRLNLKRVGQPLPCDRAALARFTASLGGRKLVLAASTHPGEEDLIVEAFRKAVPESQEAALILAPRHPERGVELTARFRAARRSAGEPPGGGIYVADTLGELGLFYRAAEVVVMGGAFLPGIGGHNPLEAARLGRGILTGPHAFNARDLYDEMIARACAIETEPADLARHIRGLLDNPMIVRRVGEAALAYAAAQGAALDDALAVLDPLLPA